MVCISFRELNLKRNYDSDESNLLEEFYIPVLKNTKFYRRLTGSFSSSIFRVAAEGLAGLINNDGTIKIIANLNSVKDDDVDAIIKGMEISNLIIKEFEEQMEKIELSDLLAQDSLATLAWLIATNRLEFKVAILLNEQGRIKRNAMLHLKIGLLQDSEGNKLSFSGSVNESHSAWVGNIEEFKVFFEWVPEFRGWYSSDEKTFEKFWNGKTKRTKIFNLPTAVVKKILEYKPESKEELLNRLKKWEDLGRKKRTETEIKLEMVSKLEKSSYWRIDEDTLKPKIEILNLRKCQRDAYKFIEQKDFVGLISMATGSGKTITAIYISFMIQKSFQKKNKALLIVISVPDIYLVRQWRDVLLNFTSRIIEVHSQTNWKEELKFKLEALPLSNRFLYVIGTNISLNKEFFNYYIKNKISTNNILFISDEVHRLGSNISKTNYDDFKPRFRIGLSATPFRYYDEDGTNFIKEYFAIDDPNSDIFYYSLRDAQVDGYLVEYEYNILPVYLNESEFKNFINITDKIRKTSFNDNKFEDGENEASNKLLIARSLILKKAVNKELSFQNLLKDLYKKSQLNKVVIYVEDNKQLDILIESFNNLKLNKAHFAVFDGESSLEERKKIVGLIENNEIEFIFAMKCLDQGVDIPVLERSIFVSSSGNPLQHIQRAGRILRKQKNISKIAEIYDFIVCPSNSQAKNYSDYSEKIKNIEYKRAKFFSNNAINNISTSKQLNDLFRGI